MNAIQADAICRLREEAYRIAREIDNGYRETLGADYPIQDTEVAYLVDTLSLPECGKPEPADVLRIGEHACPRWLAWGFDDEFHAQIRVLFDDARKLLRWIGETAEG